MMMIVFFNALRRRSLPALLVGWTLVAAVGAAEPGEIRENRPPSGAPPWPREVALARGGLLVTGRVQPRFTGPGIDAPPTPMLLRDRTLWNFDWDFHWQPGETYQLRLPAHGAAPVQQASVVAPLRPSPHLICRFKLENINRAAATGTTPDCVVKFAPDNRHLAIGSFGGHLRIADAWTGEIRYDRRLAEGMVKQLAWSPDGMTLYVGEQSPEGSLWALDCRPLMALSTDADSARQLRTTYARLRLSRIWSVRLADRLQTSRPPGDDRYGVYSWPAAYDLHVAADGRLLVAGAHAWTANGKLQRRSVVYCVTPDGQIAWTWPATDALPCALNGIGVDAAGSRALVFIPSPSATEDVRRSANAEEYAARLVLLDGHTGAHLAELPIAPLTPYFDRVESWKSTTVAADGRRGAIGLGDGRAMSYNINSQDALLEPAHPFALGTPRLVGRTPIAAAASYVRFLGDRLYLQTQNTHIPFGNSAAAQHAPSPHRGANTLTAADHDGRVAWRYRGPYALTGHWTDAGLHGPPRWLVVTCREAPGAAEPGQFGFLLFDLARPGGGEDKLMYHYPTVGPVTVDADVSADGRLIAITECPTTTPDGRDIYGEFQVHVVH